MTMLDHLPSLHRAATPRIDPAIWPSTAGVDELGRLCIGDVALTDIADEFRTPVYVLDETHFAIASATAAPHCPASKSSMPQSRC